MKPYKVKHIPTGLYFQPHKHRGSHLSKKGKIYQNGVHGLSNAMKNSRETFRVFVERDSTIHKLTKNILVYNDCSYSSSQMYVDTLTKDWIIEEI